MCCCPAGIAGKMALRGKPGLKQGPAEHPGGRPLSSELSTVEGGGPGHPPPTHPVTRSPSPRHPGPHDPPALGTCTVVFPRHPGGRRAPALTPPSQARLCRVCTWRLACETQGLCPESLHHATRKAHPTLKPPFGILWALRLRISHAGTLPLTAQHRCSDVQQAGQAGQRFSSKVDHT